MQPVMPQRPRKTGSETMPAIGAHLGIGKGLKHTAGQAIEMQLECMQFFLRNPRGSKARQLKDSEVAYFKTAMAQHRIKPVVVHVAYVCNPASPDPGLHDLARNIIAEDLERSAVIGADYLVLHPGSFTTSTPAEGIERVALVLNQVLEADQSRVTVLLETMSGQGTELGRDFAELNQIIKMVNHSERIGVCFDTCHTYAAGYDCRSKAGLGRILQEIDRSFGRERIKLIHANDCRSELGSHRDRHAHIGEGSIGLRGFGRILADPFLSTLPVIVETPSQGLLEDVNRLKKLRQHN
jgi:deoxyribonuclease-4